MATGKYVAYYRVSTVVVYKENSERLRHSERETVAGEWRSIWAILDEVWDGVSAGSST